MTFVQSSRLIALGSFFASSCFDQYMPEVGVSHSCASHKQVSSHNLQVSSKSQVTVVRIKQVTSQVIAQVKQVTSQVIQKSDDLTQFPHLKIGKESGS